MAGLKWISILAVTVAIIGAIQLASAAPVDNSLDDLNPLSYEVRFDLFIYLILWYHLDLKIGNSKFRSVLRSKKRDDERLSSM